MSGIAGIWHLDGAPEAGPRLQKMLQSLSMYGPERAGEWAEESVALGIRQLSFLPEDRFDLQPLSSPDHRYWLVGDIRLDNRNELISRLGLPSAASASTPDAAVMLAAWIRWEDHCLDHLVGDYCFAVWDRQSRRLFLARDPAGARPLFYHHDPARSRFAFASMPKGLFGLPGLAPELDEEQLACQLALVPTERGRVLFRGIARLPMGHWLSLSDRGLTITRYWRPEACPTVRFRTDDDYLEAFRERLELAVSSQLRSTGGVGSHLSSGLDSGSVTATAARIRSIGGGGLAAFTAVPLAGFEDKHADRLGNEGLAAAEVAAMHPNVEHILVEPGSSTMFEAMDPFIVAADQPPFNPTNGVWLRSILQAAQARAVRVLLTGASGNATISQGGLGVLSDWFRQGNWLRWSAAAWSLCRRRHASILGIGHATLAPSLPRWVNRRLRRRLTPYPGLVHPEVAARLNLRERGMDRFELPQSDARAGSRRLLELLDRGTHVLAGHAMCGVDERDPTADRRVVEFCFGIPAEQFVRGGQPRSLIRRAMRGRLPEATLSGRRRGIQSADWHLSMGRVRSQMATEVDLLEQSPVARRCMDLKRTRELVNYWPEPGPHSAEVHASWHLALSRGLAIGRFIRYYDPDAPRP